MQLDFNDFPLIAVNGQITSRSRGALFYVPMWALADDIVFRLNRDWQAQAGGSPSWGLQPDGFERMLAIVGGEADRQRREALNLR